MTIDELRAENLGYSLSVVRLQNLIQELQMCIRANESAIEGQLNNMATDLKR